MSDQNPKDPQTPLDLARAEAEANTIKLLGPNGQVMMDLVCHASDLAAKRSVKMPEALLLIIEAAGRIAAGRGLSLDECLETLKKSYENARKRTAS